MHAAFDYSSDCALHEIEGRPSVPTQNLIKYQPEKK